jgi:hypothetical protein
LPNPAVAALATVVTASLTVAARSAELAAAVEPTTGDGPPNNTIFFYITHQEQLLPSNILSSLPRWLHCQGGGGGKSELVLLAVAFMPNLRLCLVPLKIYYAKKRLTVI